jgi:hypothetical protein
MYEAFDAVNSEVEAMCMQQVPMEEAKKKIGL